jgi:soluble lytic murein transglycosylase-like protein
MKIYLHRGEAMYFSRKLIFPGILTGIGTIIMLTAMISPPAPVNAQVQENEKAQSRESQPEKTKKSCRLASTYPASILQWCKLIEEHADDNGLDPNFIAAVMLQESGGDSQAYSSSGAVGLMQVMPRDGIAASFQCANGPCFTSRPSMEELFDPEFNIQYGVRMLSGLQKKFGSLRDALMAYGPANVGYYYADIVLAIYQHYQ